MVSTFLALNPAIRSTQNYISKCEQVLQALCYCIGLLTLVLHRKSNTTHYNKLVVTDSHYPELSRHLVDLHNNGMSNVKILTSFFFNESPSRREPIHF